jgi:hypothetical protein
MFKEFLNTKNNIKQILFVCFFIFGFTAFSQPYNNSWINYSQKYFKFQVSETGVYRIDSVALANAAIPLSTIDPRNIQLFARGVEIPILINGENDGVFNGTDFIEFYGEKNDGWFESQLYNGIQNQPNPYYSLFNDTINYFLTWNTSISNQRIIEESDTNFSAYTPLNYFNKEQIDFYSTSYFDGETNQFGGVQFGYKSTEGWFDNYYNLGGNRTKNVATKNVYSLGPNAIIDAVVLSQSNFAGISNGDNHLRVTLGANVLDSIFEGYQKIDVQMNVPNSDLGTTTSSINFASINDLGAGAARQTVASIKINYPHNLDLEGLSEFNKMLVEENLSETKSYLSFTNFNPIGTPFLYELSTNKKIPIIFDGTNYKTLIPNTGGIKECLVSSDGNIRYISDLTAINGTGAFVDYLTSYVDTAFVIITHPNLMAEANDYASYRLNPSAGNNPQNAIVFNLNDLYDQFSYGIEKHPYAIRGFMDYIVDNWSTSPKYLFLLGKSIKANLARKTPVDFANNMVPSFGTPASDNMLTSGLNGTINEPLVPTARVAALTGTEVTWYLNKVIQHENPQPSDGTGNNDWMKKALHFAGGQDQQQSQQFINSLNILENTVEDTLFGGNVVLFPKNSSAPIQNVLSDSIKDYIADGVAIMTFLGHASATGGFDQNIDDPALWPAQNGKYPVLIGLACFAGDIHLPSANSTSEEHVLLDNKGTIGFLASVDLGLESYLVNYANQLYKNISYLNYKGSIGEHIKNTIIATQGSGSNQFSNATAHSMTFHGDPSISFNGFEKPDFMIEEPTVTYFPTTITSDLDSFDVNILVSNLGYAVNDTILISLTRDFPGNSFPDTTYFKQYKATNYQETITFRLPVDVVRGLGLNALTIIVDAPPGIVDELFENNNTVVKPLIIQSGEIIPIYPYEFQIIPNQGAILKASTAFPFEPAKDYLFEIDTTDYFNSPIKETIMINSPGGIVTWAPNLLQNMPDSTVYFWRVGKDSIDATGYKWRESSFQYIIGRQGWQQDHFFQFENNELQFVKHSRVSREFSYQSNVATLKAITNGAIGSTQINGVTDWAEGFIPSYFVDNSKIEGAGWGANSAVHVAVVDTASFDNWQSSILNMGQANYPGSGQKPNFFIFRNADPLQMDALANMLRDSVPNGYYIVMYSWYWNFFSGYSPFPASLNIELANLGATIMPSMGDSLPFALFAKKGYPSSVVEMVGDSITQKGLSVAGVMTGTANYANIFSPPLGPATRWDSLSWRMRPLEGNQTRDSTVLNVFGVDASGNETLLINNLPTDSGDIRITNTINAAQYPYLKLQAHLTDDSLFTAPQLERWQIIYADIPEAALDPDIYFSFDRDTVQEGETIKCAIAVKNISLIDMDSLLVSFNILTALNGTVNIPYLRQKPLLSDSVIILTVEFSTAGLNGLNSLLIDVNPANDQLEKFHFNNVAEIPFFVNTDKINPILDVTFDGVHILDGDIVSPEAEIVVELTDENLYLALNDTADYSVYITHPSGLESRVYFNSGIGEEIMQFIPAQLPRNSAKIIYRTNLLVDGGYQLRVQATDRSKNNSGSYDYLIGFEIINKSTITNIINYPNPFTTSTRFVFTLTGREVPDVFKIQIMTITGKVVREINKDELGSIHIGNNISEFAWNGTDRYGDQLANGLYLYRVITKINSESIELRETSADWYFKKGFGKMYLFR